MEKTEQQFKEVLSQCRSLFCKKMKDYGIAWRALRIPSVTDQIFIKARRIRSIEEKKVTFVNEGILPEFIGIVNYGIMGLIQLDLGAEDEGNMKYTPAQILDKYDTYSEKAFNLMLKKNHDYDEAWRGMRISSYTDLILVKLLRTKQIEDNHGETIVSEGIDANYYDIINYAIFGLIRLQFDHTPSEK